MRINYNNRLNKLPGIIEQCSEPVYAIFGSDNRVVLNANPDVIKIFKGTIESCTGTMELNLEFSNPSDSSKVMNYLVNA